MDKATIALILSIVSVSQVLTFGLSLLFLWYERRKSPGSVAIDIFTSLNSLAKIGWSVVLPLTVGFLIFSGGLWLFTQFNSGLIEVGSSKSNIQFEAFRDILAIVLTLAGIFIAAIGGLAFLTLRSLLADSIEKIVNERVWRALFRSRGMLGYTLAAQYESRKEGLMLALAIEVFESMDQYTTELDEQVPDSEESIGEFRKNWGYSLTLKHSSDLKAEDAKLALGFADYLESILIKHTQHANAWSHTIETIRQKFL